MVKTEMFSNIFNFKKSKRTFCKASGILRCILIFLMSILIFLISFTHIRFIIPNIGFNMDERLHYNHKKYLIKTSGCKIPDLPVSSTDLKKYLKYEFSGTHCNKDMPPLVKSNLTSLSLIESSFAKYHITDTQLLHCCYQELKRRTPRGQKDDLYEFGKICFDFKLSVEVDKEFVRVKCDYSKQNIYEDFFALVPMKYNVPFNNKQIPNNVLIIGLDSISRLNFHRQMQRTAKFLDELDFIEFLGYNKIADNTYPNLIGVLTGKSEKTIRRTCKKSSIYFDKCSFIWDHFKAQNYTTSFGEDSARMGIFNFRNYGFQNQPTDYMWGFFDLIAENLLGNSFSINVFQCIGPREVYKMLLHYIHDFVSQMHSWRVPYFAFFWSSSLSHDELNKPRTGDEVYLNFFWSMYNKGYFENTIIVIMSDHGMRFGSFRQTYQGRIEERLPLLFLRLPEEFKKKYPAATANLKRNAGMLTTPFDLHETLLDISSPHNLVDESIKNGRRNTKSEHGLSLFYPIKPTRTCEVAGITDHWCTCLHSSPVNISSEVIALVNFTIGYINDLLEGYTQCEKLHLKKILNAEILSHSEDSKESMSSEGTIKDVSISFQTIPGDGLFEATVRSISNTEMEIVDSISRLNLYGNQSSCMIDFKLKLYCYCRKKFN